MKKSFVLLFILFSGYVMSQEKTENLKTVNVDATKEKSYLAKDTPSPSLRVSTNLSELPQNIQVVNKKVLEDQNAISMLDDVIRNASGLNRVGHWQNFARVQARGVRATALRNGANVGVSFWAPLTEDMSIVDRIEFVKGPAGFMLANGEPGGLYNVVTKKPTGSNQNQVTLTSGSFDLYRGTADLDGKISDKLHYRLNLAASNMGSHRDNEFTNTYVFAPVLKYIINENTSVTLEMNRQQNQFAAIGSNYLFSKTGYTKERRNSSIAPSNLPVSNIFETNIFASIEHKINNNWLFFGQTSYLKMNQKGNSMWVGSVEEDSIQRRVSIWDAEAVAKNGQFFVNGDVKTGAIKHHFVAGLDVSHKDYVADWGQNAILTKVSYANASSDISSDELPIWSRNKKIRERGVRYNINNYMGLYFQDELRFMDDKVRLTLAGRYTNNRNRNPYQKNTLDENQFTPRAGLSISATKTTDVFAMFDQVFIGNFGYDYQGKAFKAVTGSSVEFGVKQSLFDGKLRANASYYMITKNNMLTLDDKHADENGRFSYRIATGEAQIKGIEIDVVGEIAKNLNIVMNYAICNAKITKDTDAKKVGTHLPNYAKHIQNTWLNYTFFNFAKGLRLSLGYTFQLDRKGGYVVKGMDQQADYARLDAGVGYTANNFGINLTINNLTDEFLYTGSAYPWGGFYFYQAEAGRNFRLTFSYKF